MTTNNDLNVTVKMEEWIKKVDEITVEINALIVTIEDIMANDKSEGFKYAHAAASVAKSVSSILAAERRALKDAMCQLNLSDTLDCSDEMDSAMREHRALMKQLNERVKNLKEKQNGEEQ